ncbi:MAG TPA: hypothetical protein VND64_19965 [Pirellulales bacterium]|nr:hypothetical protein [Pirellulales bacterium]
MTDEIRGNDDHLLDLLVDGELDESQRRAVLAWCERDPDGWRRCALTFLEVQSWGREMGTLAAVAFQSAIRDPQSAIESTPAPRSAPGHPLSGSAPRSELRAPRSFLPPLAMAASFALAFTLGLLIRGGGFSTQDGPSDLATAGAGADDAGARPRSLADGRAQPPLDNVRLVWDGPQGTAETIELPVVEGKVLDENWLRGQPSALPAGLLEALERSGHRVLQRRELVPLNMQDGRRLVVPVDQVDVQPVNHRRAYQ